MSQVCRVGDIGVGICLGHKDPTPFVTVFITGDPIVQADERDIAIVTTLGIASCGHLTIATSGSGLSTMSTGMGIHRVGDVGISTGGGVYVAVTGSDIITSE